MSSKTQIVITINVNIAAIIMALVALISVFL